MTYTYEKMLGRYRSPKGFPNVTSTVAIELSPDRMTQVRQVKSMTGYLSEVGGIVSILRTVSLTMILLFHFRGAYQDMTQRIFICEVDEDFKEKGKSQYGRVADFSVPELGCGQTYSQKMAKPLRHFKFKPLSPWRSIKLNIQKMAPLCMIFRCFRPSREDKLFVYAQKGLEKDLKVKNIYKQLRILRSLIRSRVTKEEYMYIKK